MENARDSIGDITLNPRSADWDFSIPVGACELAIVELHSRFWDPEILTEISRGILSNLQGSYHNKFQTNCWSNL